MAAHSPAARSRLTGDRRWLYTPRSRRTGTLSAMGAALVRQGLRRLRRFGLHPIDERLHFRPGRGIRPADDVVREARRPGLVQRQDKPAGFDIFPGVRVLHQRDALPGRRINNGTGNRMLRM
ncbi:hypothetical protein G6F68_018852 [Rhizopus microsporus]|nr:hypothetical protein G6F68_018852 [Rhizopus microsporus]